MPDDFWKHVARGPRHAAVEGQSPEVHVVQASAKAVEAQLRDLSRQGCQLRIPRPMRVGQAIAVQIDHEESGVHLSIDATIRWQQPDGETWLIGCQAGRELNWESLGELFLGGVLSSEGR